MWIVLATAALADTDCPGLSVAATLPAPRASVPIDADLVFFFENACSPGGESVRLEVVNGDTPLGKATFDNDLGGVAVLDPADDLPPNADLTLRASVAGVTLAEVPFSTTSARVVGAGPPSGRVSGATWFPNLGTAHLEVSATADDPDGLSWFRVSALGETVVTQGEAFLFGPQTDEPAALCASIVRVDGLGAESEPVEVCADEFAVDLREEEAEDEDTGDGCGGGGCGGGGASLLVLAGIGLFRRR
jgi:hypothetical protein